MRIIFNIVLLLFVVGMAHTQTTRMNVILKDGTTRSFDIGDITKITFGTVTGVIDLRHLSPVIKSFALFQNYPNPFNPSTIISYDIPRGGFVRIVIYDVTGRRVREFTRDYSEGGSYHIEWNGIADNGDPVASGLYFYQATFDDLIVSKKMLLMK